MTKFQQETFSVGLGSKAFRDNWDEVFRPVKLLRKLETGAWETIASFATVDDAVSAAANIYDETRIERPA